jgi:thiol-disulfide isomerase/thioredoxin
MKTDVQTIIAAFAVTLLSFTLTGAVADPSIVTVTKAYLSRGDLSGAIALVQGFRHQNGDSPEAIEAYSWLARGALAMNSEDRAIEFADETSGLVIKALAGKPVDSNAHLALALGAAIETQALAMDKRGQKAEAVHLLETSLVKYRGTSVAIRLHKNLNLLTLTGKPAPLIRKTDLLLPAPKTIAATKATLLFFWAHWCSDCKAEAPIISHLATEFEPQGLAVIGPTKLYGYVGGGEEAPAAQERVYIRQVFDRYYSLIPNMTVPVDSANFDTYGASTTPTIVLVDREGIVRLYNPGQIGEPGLRTAIQAVLAKPAAK